MSSKRGGSGIGSGSGSGSGGGGGGGGGGGAGKDAGKPRAAAPAGADPDEGEITEAFLAQLNAKKTSIERCVNAVNLATKQITALTDQSRLAVGDEVQRAFFALFGEPGRAARP